MEKLEMTGEMRAGTKFSDYLRDPENRDEPVAHPLLVSFGDLLDHLAGQPTDPVLQSLYTGARTALREALGLNAPVRDTGADGHSDLTKTAQQEREEAVRVPHGKDKSELPDPNAPVDISVTERQAKMNADAQSQWEKVAAQE